MISDPYKNDPVLTYIDKTISNISREESLQRHRKIPSRKEILNTHLAFIKVALLM